MVATDTVVGIVGAVLLVAVMAAVFAYEYNNIEEDDPDAAKLNGFRDEYPDLASHEDLDADGEANYLDGDFDGDNVQNAEDSEVMTSETASYTFGPFANEAQDLTFFVGTGNQAVTAELTYTSGTPAPLPASPSYQLQLLNEDGEEVASAGAQSAGGVTYTMTLNVEEPLPAGNYTLRVNVVQPGPNAGVAGSFDVHYGAHDH